jgi:hypothetical protein
VDRQNNGQAEGTRYEEFSNQKNCMGPDPGSLLNPEPDQDPGKKRRIFFNAIWASKKDLQSPEEPFGFRV